MITKTRILELLKQHSVLMQERFTVQKIGLFGSFIRDDVAPGSDIDLLVELKIPTYDHYMDLKFFLEELFQVEVDLVMADTLKPRLKPYIAREVIYV